LNEQRSLQRGWESLEINIVWRRKQVVIISIMTIITAALIILQMTLKQYSKEISVAFYVYEGFCVNIPLLVGYGFTFR